MGRYVNTFKVKEINLKLNYLDDNLFETEQRMYDLLLLVL